MLAIHSFDYGLAIRSAAVLLLYTFLAIGQLFAQALTPFPSPTGFDGVAQGYTYINDDVPTNYNGKMLCAYKGNASRESLFEFDGTNLNELLPPMIPIGADYEGTRIVNNGMLYAKGKNVGAGYLFQYDGSSVEYIPAPPNYGTGPGQGIGYVGFPFTYNGALYASYEHIQNGYDVLRYDGSNTFTAFPSPPGYYSTTRSGFGYWGSPIEYNGNMYLRFRDTSNVFNLMEFDGNTFTPIQVPTAPGSTDVYSYLGKAIIYNGSLYFGIYKVNSNVILFKYDGNVLTEIPSPPGYNSNASGGYQGLPIVFDNKLYMRYKNDQGTGVLFSYDGTNLTEIPSPAGYTVRGYRGDKEPVVYNCGLYLQYMNDSVNNTLMKYDGSSFTAYPSPAGFDGFASGYDGSPCVYEGNLYLKYLSNNSSGTLFLFNGDSLAGIPNPIGYEGTGGGRGYYGSPHVYNGLLYLKYVNNGSNFVMMRLDTMGILNHPIPVCATASLTIDSIGADNDTCSTSTGNITVFASGGTKPYAYSIDSGATFGADSIFTGLAAGTYYVVIQDNNGDEDSITVTLTGSVGADATVSVSTDGGTIIANNLMDTFVWLNCDNGHAIIPGATSNSYTPTVSGNYAVQVTRSGCIDTSVCTNITILDVKNLYQAIDIRLYPNPTDGAIYLDFGSNQSGAITITNILGQTVTEINFSAIDQLHIDLPEDAGVYFVTVETDAGNSSHKVLKE